MIELAFKCHDCGVFLNYWSNDVDVEQVDECPFCGGDSCIVYLCDAIPDDEGRWSNVEELLLKVREALQHQPDEENK